MFFSLLSKTVASLPETLVSKLPRTVHGARFGWLKQEHFATVCLLPIVSTSWKMQMVRNHRQPQHRVACDTLLMKRGKVKPCLIYCYKRITASEMDSSKNVTCGGKKRLKISRGCVRWRDFLNLLWQGIPMVLSNNLSVMVRAALLCVGCEYTCCAQGLWICRTSSHSQPLGLVTTPTTNWEPRSNISHREIATQYQKCNTRSQEVLVRA